MSTVQYNTIPYNTIHFKYTYVTLSQILYEPPSWLPCPTFVVFPFDPILLLALVDSLTLYGLHKESTLKDGNIFSKHFAYWPSWTLSFPHLFNLAGLIHVILLIKLPKKSIQIIPASRQAYPWRKRVRLVEPKVIYWNFDSFRAFVSQEQGGPIIIYNLCKTPFESVTPSSYPIKSPYKTCCVCIISTLRPPSQCTTLRYGRCGRHVNIRLSFSIRWGIYTLRGP